MLDALFEVETGTKKLVALVAEAMGAYAADGIPEEPIEFSWGHAPDPEPDLAERERVVEQRAAMWATVTPEHAAWSRRQDRLCYAVQDWRAAVDAASDLIPTVTQWTDRMDHPEIERWSAGLRRELSELGGVIHRIMIGDLPFLEEVTVRGLELGIERIQARSANLLDVGPEPAAAVPRPNPSPKPVMPDTNAQRRTHLEWFLLNLWACHDLLATVIKNHALEGLPPTPEMLAEFHKEGAIATMIISTREEAVQRFYAEVRPKMAGGLERALLEARDRAGGAAGQVIEWLQRGMDAVDKLAEAAGRVRTVYDRQWSEALKEHHEATRKLDELRPLVAAPPPAQPQVVSAPPEQTASAAAPPDAPAPAIPAPVIDQLRGLQRRFEACYASGRRLTILVARRWPIPSKDQWPSPWRAFEGNAGLFETGPYIGGFHEASTGSRLDFREQAGQACRLIGALPGLAGLGPFGRHLAQAPSRSDIEWAVALAEAAADGGCGPITASRRIPIADPATGWPLELRWDPDVRGRQLDEHPEWRRAVEALALPPDAYVIEPVGDAFVASAEAIATLLRAAEVELLPAAEPTASKSRHPEVDAASGGRLEAPPGSAIFRREGHGWLVVFGDIRGWVPHSKGVETVVALLWRPNPVHPLSALELMGGAVEMETAEHDADLASDADARAAIRDVLDRANSEIEEARDSGTEEALERALEKKERLEAQIRADIRLGGKGRRLGPNGPAEKARLAVRRRLGTAYKMLRRADPPLTALAEHLETSIKTEGTAYAYRPTGDVPDWELDSLGS